MNGQAPLAADAPAPIGFIGWGEANRTAHALLRAGFPGAPPGFRAFLPEHGELPPEVPGAATVQDLLAEQGLVFVDLSAAGWQHLLPAVRLAVSDRNVLVLCGAGLSLAETLGQLQERKLIRCLLPPFDEPGAAMVAYCPSQYVSGAEVLAFRALFAHVQHLIEVPDEARFDVSRALAGVAPAVFHTLVDALADGALMAGMPRQEAVPFLAMLLLQAARATQQGDAPPALLREAALQQEGAAAGVMELESAGLRGLLMRVVERSVAQVRSRAPGPVSSSEE